MTQLTNEQQLEITVKDLKSRILDTQDALTSAQAQGQELVKVLTTIAETIELAGDAEGKIQLEDLVTAVTELKIAHDAYLVPVEAE